jgi:hypothetical protein
MATQKQRRRRAKEKRHDYDLVYVDEEGVERPVERDDAPKKPPARVGGGSTATKSQKAKPSGRTGRRGRELQPPSWNKVLRRGAIFAPIFFATVMLLGGSKMTLAGAFAQSALLLAVFIPFSYFMDRVVWRQQQKRLNKG